MPHAKMFARETIFRDLTAGLVVFLVALPLCLGIAQASEAPLISGLIAGIVGGLVIGVLSGSHTSVAGPAAGLTAIVIMQIKGLGSFEAFLAAVIVGGCIQIALGLIRAGFLAEFVPSAVIKGLLAAIGVILILKQIPHVLGHDTDPQGDMAYVQFDKETTFSEIFEIYGDFHVGAAIVGLASIALLVVWDKVERLRKSLIPGPLVVVVFGVALSLMLDRMGRGLHIGRTHLVDVPIAESLGGFFQTLPRPDFSQWRNPAIYMSGLTLALVASLETLLNLEAVDKLDKRQRNSPPSRELWAQGVGNIASGLLGGLPVTSVIVRSSVNVNAGAQTKISAIVHGILLSVCVVFVPQYLNLIPMSSLAAILLVTGTKLASPKLVKQMWNDGKYQFAPFIITVVAIVGTDLLKGVIIGLGVSLSFILYSNLRRPIRRFVEKHLGGNVLHIELANQVSFLNRAALARALDGIQRGGHLLLDAQNTDYIDPDVLDLIRHYKEVTAPARGVEVSLVGFRRRYKLEDQIQYVDYSTRELQEAMTPAQVVQVLKEGHERFRAGKRLTRNLIRQVSATADGQHPLAVVLSCMDSRASAELIFDAGVGDLFSVRIAGNIVSRKVLGSLEYGCSVIGAKLILVLGHTRCGAVTTAVRLACTTEPVDRVTGCQHVEPILYEIQESIDREACRNLDRLSPDEQANLIDAVAQMNVHRTVAQIQEQSTTLRRLVDEGRIAVVGAMYDVATANITFLSEIPVDEETSLQSTDVTG